MAMTCSREAIARLLRVKMLLPVALGAVGAAACGGGSYEGSDAGASGSNTGGSTSGSVFSSGSVESGSVVSSGFAESGSVFSSGFAESGSVVSSGFAESGSVSSSGFAESGSIVSSGFAESGSVFSSGFAESGSVFGSGSVASGTSTSDGCVISASSYNQSCHVDADCQEVTSTDYCVAGCLCGGSAINVGALAQFNEDVSRTPLGSGALGGFACPCAASVGPCCRAGQCTLNCLSPADTLAACANAGGSCILSRYATCGVEGPANACAYSDETCCVN